MQTAARPRSSLISRLDSDLDSPECLKANAEMCVDAVCGTTGAAVTFHVTLQVTCEGQMKPPYTNWTQIIVTATEHHHLVLINVFKIYPGYCSQCTLLLHSHSRATESI